MRAGLLNEWCELYREERTQSKSGAVKKTLVLTKRVKCYRKRKNEQAATAGGEEITKGNIVLQVRAFDGIKAIKQVVYDGDRYNVVGKSDRQAYDNTYLIIAILIDE